MNPSVPILQFSQVTVDPGYHYETGLSHGTFALHPGDLFLVRIERENERLPIADAAQGLTPPVSGTVQFLDENWQTLSADRAAASRGKIGRLFEDEGWVSDLDVDENIMLSQRHHTSRTESDILEEALQFARVFGLPGLPRGRPGKLRRWDLRKAACIRAFLGKPLFIILEQPARGVFADLFDPLVNAVQSARRRGAAVLWMVADPRLWKHPGIRPSARARMFGSQLRAAEMES